MKYEKSVLFRIVIITLVLCTGIAFSEGRMNSIIPSSYSQSNYGPMLAINDDNDNAYYVKTYTIFGIEVTVITQHGKDKEGILYMLLGRATSILCYNNSLYCVLHDNYTWRGRLIRLSLSGHRILTLCSEKTGCGALLGIQNNTLYFETEYNIQTLNLDDYNLDIIADKKYYVTTSTNKGITYFNGFNYIFRPWDSGESNYTILLPEPFKDNDSTPLVWACTEECFALFDRGDSTLYLIKDQSIQQTISNVVCYSIKDGMINAVVKEHGECALLRVDLVHCDNDTPSYHSLPLSRDYVVFADTIAYFNEHGSLCLYTLPQ